MQWSVALVLAILFRAVATEELLAIFPSQSRSLFRAYEPLMQELAARGHHVTIISAFPQKKVSANITDIIIPITKPTEPQSKSAWKLMWHLGEESALKVSQCQQVLGNPRVQLLLKGGRLFDLIFVEFELHQCFLGLTQKHRNAPVIGLFGPTGSHVAHDVLGNTSPYSYIPNTLQMFTDHMSFIERVLNCWVIMTERWQAYMENAKFAALLKEYFPNVAPLPPIEELQKRIKFVFFYNDVSIGIPRPLLPNMVDVAGMHIRPPNKLTKEMEDWLSGSSKQVLVVSMGNLPKNILAQVDQELIAAFSKLDLMVVWMRKGAMKKQPSNVIVPKALALNDILGHPRVQLLVTDGDFLDIQTAVYNSVPILGIPFTPDQTGQVLRAQTLGFGIYLPTNQVTGHSLRKALHQIIANESYQSHAQIASERFRDQPTSPLRRAVYWSEYVMRHEGARHLQAASRDLAWYEYFLLDAMAVLMGGAVAAMALVYVVVQVLCLLLRTRRQARHRTTAREHMKND